MKNNKTKKNFEKIVLKAEIKNLREIMNYLLDNFNKEDIKLEFLQKNLDE